MQRLGLEDWFDAVADGNDITRSKPDPEVFLLAAERLRLPPGECMVVEDADAGIEAALAGGFIPAGIGTAKGNAKAAYHLEQFGQLIELCGHAPGGIGLLCKQKSDGLRHRFFVKQCIRQGAQRGDGPCSLSFQNVACKEQENGSRPRGGKADVGAEGQVEIR